MKKEIEMVRDFHLKYGQAVRTVPVFPLTSYDEEQLRVNLIFEEARELEEAKSIEDIADAITDLLYVTIGTAHAYGIGDRLPALFAEVHRSNMTKVAGKGPAIGKVQKGDHYDPPRIDKCLATPLGGAGEQLAMPCD